MSIEKIVNSIIEVAPIDSIGTLLKKAVTLNYHIGENECIAGLSQAEQYIYEYLQDSDIKISESGNFVLAFQAHGKFNILEQHKFEKHSHNYRLLSYINLDEETHLKFKYLCDKQNRDLMDNKPQIMSYFAKHGYHNICLNLLDLIQHIAPLIYYVNDYCFANFYSIGKDNNEFSNTLENVINNVLSQQDDAKIEYLNLVYCMDLLLKSGTYTRLEEINSYQLNIHILEKFFVEKYDFYKKNYQDIEIFNKLDLESFALLLQSCREEIVQKHRFIRIISGINLIKKEEVLNFELLEKPISDDIIINALNSISQNQSLVNLLVYDFNNFLHSECINKDFNSNLEYLISLIVDESIKMTNSEFGMTRGVKNFHNFLSLLENNQASELIGLGQSEYFCHVSPKINHSLDNKKLLIILNSISARMRFNSWHYAPSYLNTKEVTPSRTWFHAPRMADIAEYSDNHHNGHIHAAVRYSIRSPATLLFKNKPLIGFIDLRLMRSTGNKYSKSDLELAIFYTEILRFMYQKLLNHQINNNDYIFSFGNKNWFENMYSSNALRILTE